MADLATQYRFVSRRRRLVVAALFIATFVTLVIDLSTGPAALGVLDVVKGLLFPDTLALGDRIILWDVRLPDSLIALAVGAALGVAGTETQTILNNPLASPFTLGLQSAAVFGASLMLALPIEIAWITQHLAVPAMAFLGALSAGGAVLFFSRLFRGSVGAIVLFGIAVLFFCDALTAILQFISSDEAVRDIVFWRLGDLTKAEWTEVMLVFAATAVVLPFTLGASASLTAVRGGEEVALGAGLTVERMRYFSILRVSVLTAMAVSFVGAISFIGLVSPHIARLLIGEDHRFLIPGAALTGACLLSLASCFSKAVIPGVIVPVGIATSVIGVPIFVALILSQRRVQT